MNRINYVTAADICCVVVIGGGTFFKVGGTSARQKYFGKIFWFE